MIITARRPETFAFLHGQDHLIAAHGLNVLVQESTFAVRVPLGASSNKLAFQDDPAAQPLKK
jgi:hypothetical protein